MAETDAREGDAIAGRLRQQAETDRLRVTVHAHQEMVEEDISLEDVRDVLLDPVLIENYPEHKRGPCCLVGQRTARGRYVHVVCTTSLDIAIIITVYEPRPPKWATPFERGRRA
ncbi:MAG: DUF4258 domain-containing protein [Acidobacteriota bacterium]